MFGRRHPVATRSPQPFCRSIGMQNAFVEFHGSFRYATFAALDRALHEARDHLDDDEVSDQDRDWMRHLCQRGMTVHVNAVLPEYADRFLAAAILGALARRAVDGRVDVTRGSQRLDTFASEASPSEVVA